MCVGGKGRGEEGKRRGRWREDRIYIIIMQKNAIADPFELACGLSNKSTVFNNGKHTSHSLPLRHHKSL